MEGSGCVAMGGPRPGGGALPPGLGMLLGLVLGGDIIERRWFEVGLRLVIDIFIAGHARIVVDRLHF